MKQAAVAQSGRAGRSSERDGISNPGDRSRSKVVDLGSSPGCRIAGNVLPNQPVEEISLYKSMGVEGSNLMFIVFSKPEAGPGTTVEESVNNYLTGSAIFSFFSSLSADKQSQEDHSQNQYTEIKGGEKFIENTQTPPTSNQLYKYEQDRAVESKRSVYQAITESAMPWRRVSGLDQELGLSIGSIHNHLQKLLQEEKVVRVGVRYVAVEDVQSMSVDQLHKLKQDANEEVLEATEIQLRLDEKVEMRKEQLRDRKEDLSPFQFRKEEQEIIELMDSSEYYKRKQRRSNKVVKLVYSELEKRRSSKTEKVHSDSPHRAEEPVPVTH